MFVLGGVCFSMFFNLYPGIPNVTQSFSLGFVLKSGGFAPISRDKIWSYAVSCKSFAAGYGLLERSQNWDSLKAQQSLHVLP